jgi:hypothetical protein
MNNFSSTLLSVPNTVSRSSNIQVRDSITEQLKSVRLSVHFPDKLFINLLFVREVGVSIWVNDKKKKINLLHLSRETTRLSSFTHVRAALASRLTLCWRARFTPFIFFSPLVENPCIVVYRLLQLIQKHVGIKRFAWTIRFFSFFFQETSHRSSLDPSETSQKGSFSIALLFLLTIWNAWSWVRLEKANCSMEVYNSAYFLSRRLRSTRDEMHRQETKFNFHT